MYKIKKDKLELVLYLFKEGFITVSDVVLLLDVNVDDSYLPKEVDSTIAGDFVKESYNLTTT